MRFLATLAAALTMLVGVPALAQDPIAEAIEAIDNYDSDGAKTILDTACKARNAEACWRLALIYSGDYSDEGRAAADKLFLANCARSDARSCYMLAGRVPYDASEKDKAKASTALVKACDGGLGFACTERADALRYANDSDKAVVAKLYEQGCAHGSRGGCTGAAAIYGETWENPMQDFAKAIELGRKACEMGDGEACSALPGYEEAQLGTENPSMEVLLRWQGYLQKACAFGLTSSCTEYYSGQITLP